MFTKAKETKPDGHLPWWQAVGHSLVGGRSIEFYPRIVEVEGGEPRSLNSEAILAAAAGETARWPAVLDADQLKNALERARESLDEVKALTEYQDQKATRLLTVATFLTAFSGVLFNRFSDSYPLRATFEQPFSLGSILIPLAYLAFGVFVLGSVSGGLVTFHATRTRFKYPQTHQHEIAKQESDPKSMLFADTIIRVSPGAWTRAFVDVSTGTGTEGPAPERLLRPDLQTRYLQNYVTESYLIAAKTADKLRYLQPAQRLLSVALSFLLLWLFLLALIAATVDSTKPAAGPVAISIRPSAEPIPVSLRQPSRPADAPPPPPRVEDAPQKDRAAAAAGQGSASGNSAESDGKTGS